MSKKKRTTEKTTTSKKKRNDSKTSTAINIQGEIQKILDQEFERLVKENAHDPLFDLLQSDKLDDLSIEEIRKMVLGDD